MKVVLNLACLIFPFFVIAQDTSTTSQSGTASYYAKKFEGRKCSSGERFRHDSLTAAHKTLPFGTRVKVTNIKNDSVVIVKINDRLPKKSKRVIDLTRRAAKQLNFIRVGLTKVKIEVIKDSLP
jgi:rare lipoprotein A